MDRKYNLAPFYDRATTWSKRFAYLRSNGGTPLMERQQLAITHIKFVTSRLKPMTSSDKGMANTSWWGCKNIYYRLPLRDGSRTLRVSSSMRELHETLLDFFGTETMLPKQDQCVEDILMRGQLWIGNNVDYYPGDSASNAENVGLFYLINPEARNLSNLAIAKGYALRPDGMWVQHQWLVLRQTRSVRIIETNARKTKFLAYFGYVVMPEEMEGNRYN